MQQSVLFTGDCSSVLVYTLHGTNVYLHYLYTLSNPAPTSQTPPAISSHTSTAPHMPHTHSDSPNSSPHSGPRPLAQSHAPVPPAAETAVMSPTPCNHSPMQCDQSCLCLCPGGQTALRPAAPGFPWECWGPCARKRSFSFRFAEWLREVYYLGRVDGGWSLVDRNCSMMARWTCQSESARLFQPRRWWWLSWRRGGLRRCWIVPCCMFAVEVPSNRGL